MADQQPNPFEPVGPCDNSILDRVDIGHRIATKSEILAIDAITGAPLEPEKMVRIGELGPALTDYLKAKYPSLQPNDQTGKESVQRLRKEYITKILSEDGGPLSPLETEVAESIASRGTLAEDTETEFDGNETLGGRIADVVATFGGSWTFILGFAILVAAWMTSNLFVGREAAFDEYPFVLLNLVLSTNAAFQAPVIMMSQRRQEAKSSSCHERLQGQPEGGTGDQAPA